MFPAPFRLQVRHDPEKWNPIFGQDHANEARATTID
jgi:hypothetical protein